MRPLTVLLLLLVAPVVWPPPVSAEAGWTWPVRGEVITQYRNGDDPYAAGQHRGVDIAAPVGAPVVAAADGVVVHAGAVGSSGLTVSQRTRDGDLIVSYLHLSAVAVRRGDPVAAGTPIGAVGVSGRRATAAPHLHLGVRDAGDRHGYLDPLRFLAPPPADAPQPRPVPAPLPMPVPALPGPAPAAEPGPASAPDAASVPSGLPAATLGTLVAPATASAPSRSHGMRTDSPSRVPAPGRHGEAAHTGSADSRSRPALHRPGTRVHVPLEGPSLPVRGGPQAVSPPSATRNEEPAGGHGLDLGWLAACAGLVIAATLLAGPRRGGRSPAPGRATVAALLRAGSRG